MSVVNLINRIVSVKCVIDEIRRKKNKLHMYKHTITSFATRLNEIANSHSKFEYRNATRTNYLNAKQQACPRLIIFFAFLVIHCRDIAKC